MMRNRNHGRHGKIYDSKDKDCFKVEDKRLQSALSRLDNLEEVDVLNFASGPPSPPSATEIIVIPPMVRPGKRYGVPVAFRSLAMTAGSLLSTWVSGV